MSKIYNWTKDNSPNPGSDEAVELGCTCAVLDNNHGLGVPRGDGKPNAFWITGNCPLHDPDNYVAKQEEQ